jgi:thiamine-phosphate pyrophosphorylase
MKSLKFTNHSLSKIYLISKPAIPDLDLYIQDLELIFATQHIDTYQLRLKNCTNADWIKAGEVTKALCQKYNINFILNDRADLINTIKPDGIHLGQSDGDISPLRKEFGKNFIIGRSCYDSKEFAQKACDDEASYIAFGTFFPSKSKEQIYKPKKELINWAKTNLKTKICAIGGLYPHNLEHFKGFEPDYYCFISAIWDSDNKKSVLNEITKIIT